MANSFFLRLKELLNTMDIREGSMMDSLCKLASPSSFRKGEKLPLSVKEKPQIYVLLDGLVCCEQDTPDGRAVVESLYYSAGSVVNPLSTFTGTARGERCVCLCDSNFAVFPLAELKLLAESKIEFMRLYTEQLTGKLGELHGQNYMLSLRSEDKYRWYLRHFAEVEGQIPLYIVAQFLEIDPATLSRIRKKLRTEQHNPQQ